jgi:hypothetical protein
MEGGGEGACGAITGGNDQAAVLQPGIDLHCGLGGHFWVIRCVAGKVPMRGRLVMEEKAGFTFLRAFWLVIPDRKNVAGRVCPIMMRRLKCIHIIWNMYSTKFLTTVSREL